MIPRLALLSLLQKILKEAVLRQLMKLLNDKLALLTKHMDLVGENMVEALAELH